MGNKQIASNIYVLLLKTGKKCTLSPSRMWKQKQRDEK